MRKNYIDTLIRSCAAVTLLKAVLFGVRLRMSGIASGDGIHDHLGVCMRRFNESSWGYFRCAETTKIDRLELLVHGFVVLSFRRV